MQVTVVGAGYVGLIAAVCLAASGHDVRCVDADEKKVRILASGGSPIYEPGLEDLISSTIGAGRLSFCTAENGWREVISEVTIVAVGTPMLASGAADLSHVREVVRGLCEAADIPFTLVMKSTVPVGTGLALMDQYLSTANSPVRYVANPEFLREGRAIEDWYHTDRIVLGAASSSDLESVRRLYEDIDAPLLETDITSAETIKYASNAFLSTKISFINEIANLCDAVGADIDDVSAGIGMDDRINPHFLKAGIGYGGSCFPKDTRALEYIASVNGYQFSLLKSVIDVNRRQRVLPVMALLRHFSDLSGCRIAVLGLSFKPETDDVRESPAAEIVSLLIERGASVAVYDPLAASVDLPGATRTETAAEALQGAACAIVSTEWQEFVDLDWMSAAAVMECDAVVFDGRNCLDREGVEAAGLKYMAVGRPGAHRAITSRRID